MMPSATTPRRVKALPLSGEQHCTFGSDIYGPQSSRLVVPSAAKRPATLDPSLGVPAVGLLLAVATFAQTLAGLMQARKEDTTMVSKLYVTYSSLMVTASSVLINLATASSPLPSPYARSR
jgi:hypothetical protein